MFERGFLSRRVTVLSRSESQQTAFGLTGGGYVPVKTIWANIKYTKGVKAMREGALDAYESFMIRCDYHEAITRDCRLSFGDRIYNIDNLNADKESNEMQIICTELIK